MKNLSYLISLFALLLVFLICGAEACETELPEETNIEVGFYP